MIPFTKWILSLCGELTTGKSQLQRRVNHSSSGSLRAGVGTYHSAFTSKCKQFPKALSHWFPAAEGQHKAPNILPLGPCFPSSLFVCLQAHRVQYTPSNWIPYFHDFQYQPNVNVSAGEVCNPRQFGWAQFPFAAFSVLSVVFRQRCTRLFVFVHFFCIMHARTHNLTLQLRSIIPFMSSYEKVHVIFFSQWQGWD